MKTFIPITQFILTKTKQPIDNMIVKVNKTTFQIFARVSLQNPMLYSLHVKNMNTNKSVIKFNKIPKNVVNNRILKIKSFLENEFKLNKKSLK